MFAVMMLQEIQYVCYKSNAKYYNKAVTDTKSISNTDTDTWRPIPTLYPYVMMMMMIDALPESRSSMTQCTGDTM